MTTPGDVRHAAEVTHRVSADDTAMALGSGDLPVLATPRLIAWCEEATCAAFAAADPDAATTSVGTHVDIEHLAATAVGTTVIAAATLVAQNGRRVAFEVAAHDAAGHLLARGRIERVAVDRARFMARLGGVGD